MQLENRPMPSARLDDFAMSLVQEIFAKPKTPAKLLDTRNIRGFVVMREALGTSGETPVTGNDRVEPGFAHAVMRRVAAKRINKHVRVGQNHRWRFRYSRSFASWSAAESTRLMPGIKPLVAFLTRGGTRALSLRSGASFTIRRNPSSINSVKERPSSGALGLARRMSSSGNRTVVLSAICHDKFVGKQNVHHATMTGCR